MSKPKAKVKVKKNKKKIKGGNNLEAHINKGLTKHQAINAVEGAGSVKVSMLQ